MEGTTAEQRPTAQDTAECAAKLVPRPAHASAAHAEAGTPPQATCRTNPESLAKQLEPELPC